MRKSTSILFRLVRAVSGQDIIEYAMMAGFITVAVLAVFPGSRGEIEKIFKKVECAAKGQDFQVAGPGSVERFTCVPRQGGR